MINKDSKHITIKAESLPNRCDICHKSDYYNPDNNYCSRCSVINSELNIKHLKNIAINITSMSNWIIQLLKFLICIAPFITCSIFVLYNSYDRRGLELN